MSRIGRKPIAIPAGVTVDVKDNLITVKGPKGELKQEFGPYTKVEVNGSEIVLTRTGDSKEEKSQHGLYRVLTNNMVVGVTKGFEKNLVVNGIGFKVAVSGSKLVLNIGFSHPIEVEAPAGITFTCPDANNIKVAGIDKQLVGATAAKIKSLRVPDPYHAYGIRYDYETIAIKEGKTAGK